MTVGMWICVGLCVICGVLTVIYTVKSVRMWKRIDTRKAEIKSQWKQLFEKMKEGI